MRVLFYIVMQVPEEYFIKNSKHFTSEIKEARERRKAQAILLKQEKQLRDSVHVWNTTILPKWNTM